MKNNKRTCKQMTGIGLAVLLLFVQILFPFFSDTVSR